MKRGVNPETIVLNEIIARLKTDGYEYAERGHPGNFWRMAVGPVLKKRGAAKNPLKGFPDLMGVLKTGGGQMFAIEVKRADGGTVSPDQRAWLTHLNSMGVLCIVGRSADYVARIIATAEKRARGIVWQE